MKITLAAAVLATLPALAPAAPHAARPLPHARHVHHAHHARARGIDQIETVVVLYGENRSFDNLYGTFPGADGIAQASVDSLTQRDRDGSVLATLPPVWDERDSSKPDPAYPTALPNAPFQIDAPPVNLPLTQATRDLAHRFYQNQMQIDGGRNDRFAAWSDAGALTMGHYDGSRLRMWQLAREFTLADHFFMGAFGGSYLNHMWLACACTPRFPDAPADMHARLDASGQLLQLPDSPAHAAAGAPHLADAPLTPDGYTVNTVQPSYQPSGIAPARGGNAALADPAEHPLPPQDETTIGDTLSARHVSWKWYAGGFQAALRDRGIIYEEKSGINFQPHHQPFNYFRRYAPGTAARRAHLKDETDLLADIARGTLPQVVFYKPQGSLNEHPGYSDVQQGDLHLAGLVDRLRHSRQWAHMAIIVTYDENGGFWDHVAPPKGDRWGPGSRIPAIIISPYARRGFVDHTTYDTTSILQFLTKRFGLTPLPGVRTQMGDLSHAFAFP